MFVFLFSGDTGFHVDEDSDSATYKHCLPNICTCQNGTAHTGVNCYEHEKELCESCDLGYRKEGDVCTRICFCGNGTVNEDLCPNGDEPDTPHSLTTCGVCNDKFGLHQFICEQKYCVCDGGIPATEEMCEVHRSNTCAECFVGYTMNNEIDRDCIEHECWCDHGIGTRGAECLPNGTHICKECELSHELRGEPFQTRCEKLLCNCIGGKPVDDDDCDESIVPRLPWQTVSMCKYCVDELGYHKIANFQQVDKYVEINNASFADTVSNCDLNQCTCSSNFGFGAQGTFCPIHGNESCHPCFQGYSRNEDLLCEVAEDYLDSRPPWNNPKLCIPNPWNCVEYGEEKGCFAYSQYQDSMTATLSLNYNNTAITSGTLVAIIGNIDCIGAPCFNGDLGTIRGIGSITDGVTTNGPFFKNVFWF